jgi:DNA mismatch repair protein MutL
LVVRGVPSFFAHAQVVDVVRDIAALAESNLNPASFEQEVDHVAARLACHASIRSGRELERAEVYALFEALDSTEFSAACPHGRPIAVRFQREDIETWFGRDR